MGPTKRKHQQRQNGNTTRAPRGAKNGHSSDTAPVDAAGAVSSGDITAESSARDTVLVTTSVQEKLKRSTLAFAPLTSAVLCVFGYQREMRKSLHTPQERKTFSQCCDHNSDPTRCLFDIFKKAHRTLERRREAPYYHTAITSQPVGHQNLFCLTQNPSMWMRNCSPSNKTTNHHGRSVKHKMPKI